MKKSIAEKYKDRKVNPKYYQTIKISGGIEGEPKTLTRKEFQEGKQGIVWADNETGKLVFEDEEKPIGLIEGIRQYEANKPPVRLESELNKAYKGQNNMTIYGGFEFIEKLRKLLPKKYFK
ncbi:MAG: hypothetical protein WC428_01195 [Candidatus Paceibacterota bacterium]